METHLFLIGLVIISLVVIGFILIRGDRSRSRLSQQIIEFSEMAKNLAQEQAQIRQLPKLNSRDGWNKVRPA